MVDLERRVSAHEPRARTLLDSVPEHSFWGDVTTVSAALFPAMAIYEPLQNPMYAATCLAGAAVGIVGRGIEGRRIKNQPSRVYYATPNRLFYRAKRPLLPGSLPVGRTPTPHAAMYAQNATIRSVEHERGALRIEAIVEDISISGLLDEERQAFRAPGRTADVLIAGAYPNDVRFLEVY